MLNFGASKPRVKGGPVPPGPPWIRTCIKETKVSSNVISVNMQKSCACKQLHFGHFLTLLTSASRNFHVFQVTQQKIIST